MNTLQVTILLLASFAVLRIHLAGRKRKIELDTLFELYRLRDQLRMGVVTGTIPDDTCFTAMDIRLSRLVEHQTIVNPWVVFSPNMPTHVKNIEKHEKEFIQRISSASHQELMKVYKEHKKPLSEYIYKRHWVFVLTIRSIVAVLKPILAILHRIHSFSLSRVSLANINRDSIKAAASIVSDPVLIERLAIA